MRKGRRVRKPLRKRVASRRRVSTRLVETKEVTIGAGTNLVSVDNVNWGTTNNRSLTPGANEWTIDPGTGNGQRIGNRITVKRVKFRFVLTPMPWTVSTVYPRPYIVVLYLGHLKPNAVQSLQGWSDALYTKAFSYGAGSVLGLTGTLFDLVQPINRELLTIRKRYRFKIGYQNYTFNHNNWNDLGNGSVSLPPSAHYGWANNDFKSSIVKAIDITKYFPRDIVFDDTTGIANAPTSRPLYCSWEVIPADGTSLAPTDTGVTCNWRLDLSYIDL